jgi:hypothetical protein
MWRRKTEAVDNNNQVVDRNTNSPVQTTRQYTANSPGLILARLVWIVASIIIALLAIRFFFILFGANPGNGFVDFIYNVSYPFARPFFGIFGYHLRYGTSRVEMASIVAIVIYGLAAYLIGRLLSIGHPQSTV